MIDAILQDHMQRLFAHAIQFVKNEKQLTAKSRHVKGACALLYPGTMGKNISAKLDESVELAMDAKQGVTNMISVPTVQSFMQHNKPIDFRVAAVAAVAMTAALEALSGKIIEEILASGHDGTMITSRDVTRGIRCNADIAKVMAGLVFTMGDHYRRKTN